MVPPSPVEVSQLRSCIRSPPGCWEKRIHIGSIQRRNTFFRSGILGFDWNDIDSWCFHCFGKKYPHKENNNMTISTKGGFQFRVQMVCPFFFFPPRWVWGCKNQIPEQVVQQVVQRRGFVLRWIELHSDDFFTPGLLRGRKWWKPTSSGGCCTIYNFPPLVQRLPKNTNLSRCFSAPGTEINKFLLSNKKNKIPTGILRTHTQKMAQQRFFGGVCLVYFFSPSPQREQRIHNLPTSHGKSPPAQSPKGLPAIATTGRKSLANCAWQHGISLGISALENKKLLFVHLKGWWFWDSLPKPPIFRYVTLQIRECIS